MMNNRSTPPQPLAAHKLHRAGVLLSGLLGFLLPAAAFAQEAAPDTPEQAYMTYGCVQCHGTVGQGGGAGLRLAPSPLDYESFSDVVRRPYGVMPAYSPRVLPEETLELIYEYVASIPEPPTAADIPALRLE